MTGDTTPQQQAVDVIRQFIVTNVGYDLNGVEVSRG